MREMIMSTTTSTHGNAADYLAETGAPKFERVLSTLRRTMEGIAEGFAASRRYHELTARGMAHEQAASKVFLERFGGR
jgi:hypothetical protein